MPHADTAAMNAHLAGISRTVAEGAHAVLVLDGAGWHGSKALRVPDNITLLPLPPYAPERNPIENVWAYLRANRLANAVFETCEEIVARCCDARNFFANDSDTVRSITTRDYAKTVKVRPRHGHPRSRRRRRRHWRQHRRRDPRRQRRHHRRLHRLHHRLGRRQLDHLVAGAHPAHRGRAARHAAHHLGHRGRGDPAALRPDADGRQHHLGDGFPRGDEDHHAGRRQGRRGRQGQDDRVSLLRQLRRRALRGPDHRHRAHLGRRQADGPLRRHLALVSGRRGADRRSVHRREDGRGQHARLSRHGLCGLRGTGALDLWQPPAAALLRGVPAARRSRHRRGADPRRHHDPGLGRVHLRDAGDPQDRWRRDGAREPERAGRLHRHGGGAGPAAGHGARGRERQPRGGLVRRRSARGLLQGAAGRRGVGQIDHARQLVGEWRQPRQCLPRQPRRSGPPRLWRHAVRLRGGAGDPGDEGARAARDLLSVHPDGRAARQHACRTRIPTTPPRRASPRSPGGGGSPVRRRRASPGPWTRPPRPQARSRRCSARPRPPASASRARASWTGRPATGACAAWCCTTPISARRRAGSMPS
jgi:hypothetical protein